MAETSAVTLATTTGGFVCGPTRVAIDRAIAAALADLPGPSARKSSGGSAAEAPHPARPEAASERSMGAEVAAPQEATQGERAFVIGDVLGERGSAEHGFVIAALAILGCLLAARLFMFAPATAGVIAPLGVLAGVLGLVAAPKVRECAGEQPTAWWCSWAALGVVWMPGLIRMTGERLDRGERTMLWTCWGAMLLGVGGALIL